PWLSRDARYVVFASEASNLVDNDQNDAPDIFVRDRIRHVTRAVSRNYLGTGTGNGASRAPFLSADGRTIVFQSFASDLTPGDYNETRDVFVATIGDLDDDRDGMDDDWEMAFFGTLDRDGSGDFDGDGRNDRDEFRLGTNPSDPSSDLRL